MKLTVCINDTKIVVPCGDGELSIRQLAELAIIRYRKSALSKGSYSGNFEIKGLKLARDGGVLDWDDRVHDVLDDRDMLIAQYSSNAEDTTVTHPSILSSPPLNHHNSIRPGDIITSDRTGKLAPVSSDYVPLAFINPDYYNNRHNSIPCSDHDIHRYFDLFDSTTSARHESLDDILDLNIPNRKMHNHISRNPDYEKWPLPPFPALSTLQSSMGTSTIPKNINLQLHDANGDDLTWDNSPNECDEEDYPLLRPDYIVKHVSTNQEKSIENSVPSRQVLQWLESQDCVSASGSSAGGGCGGGGGGSGGGGCLAASSSYEAGSDIKESDSTNNAAIVLDDRYNNGRVHASNSSVSSGNDPHNRPREELPSVEYFSKSQQPQNYPDNSIIVRLNNMKPGENLGIQIVPVYIQDQIYANNAVGSDQRCISAIEVRSILSKGRVAKGKQLNKGDKIIQINDVNLFGMLFERGDAIFRDALQKSHCKLRVIPYQYPGLNPVPVQVNKGNPPPPPRRSPNTALSRKKSNSESSDKGPNIGTQQPYCKSPIPNALINIKTTSSKFNSAPPPPSIQQYKPIACSTSGFGSMLQTPASSTSSMSVVERKRFDKIPNNPDTVKTELIELTKIGSGFGFSITGVDNQPPNIPTAIYVRHILPDGAAIRDGRLKSDDRLLEIDGLLLDGMTQSEVISLLREKPSGSRVKLLVERNEMIKNSPCSASHDSLMTSLSEIDEDCSTLSNNKRNAIKLRFDIPLNDSSCPGGKTTLGISVKVEPNWDRANITPFSSKEDIAASNIMWVKTVIENGAAYRHGKLMVGDQVLEVNGVALSGLSSEEALTKLKNLIKEAQDSDDGIISMVITRKANIARSSSLNTLNSMTCSSSAMSYKPIFDLNWNASYKLANNKKLNNIPRPQSRQSEQKDSKLLSNRLMGDLQNYSVTILSTKSPKRSAPLPPIPDHGNTENSSLDTSTKTKPAPPPPPLSRRLKNIESCYDVSQFVPKSVQATSDVTTNVDNNYATYSVNQIGKSAENSDEFLPKNIDGLQCSSTTNTLCRNKENSQLILRARNTRSNCSYTPTKEVLHIDDIDWDKMELIPFDNCQLNSKNPLNKASSSQPVINQEIHSSKRFHDTGVRKRKAFKKFSIGQIFRFKHSHYSKPSNSVGSSPVNTRKHKEPSDSKKVIGGTAIPTSSSSFSLKSSETADETEFPYAELDFSHSQAASIPESTSVFLKTINNLKTTITSKNALLPLPEESFKCLQAPPSEDSDSDEDFVDMQVAFPGHVSAVQRITAAMPKQPPNRFVYEDAEELFQSLQANVSLYHDINLSPSTFSQQPNAQTNSRDCQSTSKDLYQNIMSDLSTSHRPKPNPSSTAPSTTVLQPLKPTNQSDVYFNWPVSPK